MRGMMDLPGMPQTVTPGLDPGVSGSLPLAVEEMPGSSPGMTTWLICVERKSPRESGVNQT